MSEADARPRESGDETAVLNPPRGGAALSWDAFLSTYLPALVLAVGTGIAVPAIPTLAKSFGVSFGLASGVVTAFLLGNLAGTIPSGWLIDRFGRRPVLIAGPLLTSAMAFMVAFAHSFPELLVLRFFDGCAAQMWLMAPVGRDIARRRTRAARPAGQLDVRNGQHRQARGPGIGRLHRERVGAARAVLGLCRPRACSRSFRPRCSPRTRRAASEARRTKARAASRPLSLRQIVMPRLVYFGVALFAGLTRGPVQADLLHLYAAFAYQLGPRQIGYLATGAAVSLACRSDSSPAG